MSSATLWSGLVTHREGLYEMGVAAARASVGRDPATAVGLEALEPIRVGPFYADRSAIANLLAVTDGEAGEFETPDGEYYLPPTAAVTWLSPVLMKSIRRAGLKLALSKVLHGENEVRFDRVPTTAEALTLEARVAAVDHNERRTLMLLRAIHRDEAGSHVFTVDTTFFFPGERPKKNGRPQPAAASKAKDAIRIPYDADEIFRFRANLEASRGYASVSGDFNPIHIAQLGAKAVGFRTAIAHGYATKARMGHQVIHQLLDGDPTRVRRFSVRFAKPVFMGQSTGIYVGTPKPTPEGLCVEVIAGPGPGESACVHGELVYV